METKTTQTRCPHCSVAFHITNTQLAAAAGKVRCGICLDLFDANENACAPAADPTLPADDLDREYPDLTPTLNQDQDQDKTDQIPGQEELHINDPADPEPGTPESGTPPTESKRTDLVDNQQSYHYRQLDTLANTLQDQNLLSTSRSESGSPGLIRWAMYLLIISGIGLLLIQLLFFTSADLSQKERYRPTLQMVCGLLGCPITPLRDIRLIRADALVVQDHPTRKNALHIDVVLTNRASFAQAFPKLQLQFEDLKGNVVAKRTFQPEEYLQGQLTGLSVMTPIISYRIKLDILAPDKSAISYSLIVTN